MPRYPQIEYIAKSYLNSIPQVPGLQACVITPYFWSPPKETFLPQQLKHTYWKHRATVRVTGYLSRNSVSVPSLLKSSQILHLQSMLPHLKFSLDMFYDYCLGKVNYVYHKHLFYFVNHILLNVCIPQSIFLPCTPSMQKSTQYINISASVFPSSVLDISITAFIKTELTPSPVYNM